MLVFSTSPDGVQLCSSQYESRFAASHSQHGGSVYAGHALELPTVAEDEAGH